MTGLDKIIVSNRSALSKKYTETEVQMIEAAVADLVESDRAREIESRLFYLDDKAMRGFGCRPVRGPADARGNKDAIDRLYKHYSPAYIMILGAPDVVPHIKVTNLTRDEDGRIIDSDLPYACDARFHRDARRFLAPTRVVGRLPDINGGGDPRYLIGLLENATQVVRLPRTDYASWFALSARSWTGSSAITAANLFSNLDGLTLCPPTGPGKHKTLHKTRIHFFNCHGNTSSHVFWGEQGKAQPELSQQQYSLTTPAWYCHCRGVLLRCGALCARWRPTRYFRHLPATEGRRVCRQHDHRLWPGRRSG